MKQEALNVFAQDQIDAAGKLYDAGFSDGVASVPPSGGLSQADVDSAVAAAKAADAEALKAAQDLDTVLQAKIDQIKALLG